MGIVLLRSRLFQVNWLFTNFLSESFTATSVLGILERDQEQSVVYGSIDFGKTVVTSEKYEELMEKAAQQLKILPHRYVTLICSSFCNW